MEWTLANTTATILFAVMGFGLVTLNTLWGIAASLERISRTLERMEETSSVLPKLHTDLVARVDLESWRKTTEVICHAVQTMEEQDYKKQLHDIGGRLDDIWTELVNRNAA